MGTTLHEAIAQVLRSSGHSLTTAEIAEKLNAVDGYSKADGSTITDFQVHGRTKNYPRLFTRDGNMVSLSEWE